MSSATNGEVLEHPTGSILAAYGHGQLADDELVAVDAHLAECDECRQVVEGVVPDTLLTLLRSAATDADDVDLAEPKSAASKATLIVPPQELLAHPRYKVGELLGIGGMGAVYKAEHLLMERPVALKVLDRKLTGNPATTDRFRREVRAAARLTHPHIVAAFDAEQAGDVHFLVMEFVDGVSLARRLAEKGPLPVDEASDYIRQAALGLQHAHERGMVHRDIKPQNLMLTPAGQVKILDFGLARFVMECVPGDANISLEEEPLAGFGKESLAIRLTHTGLVMGTPDYIAPEQARDSHLADIRADIYSLGCTLYELLAGQSPFPEGKAVDKVRGHLSRTPQPLDQLRRDVPPELLRIVERMMAKEPANRFQTPADVAAALTPLVAAPPPPKKNWRPAIAACLGFFAFLLAGTVIYIQTDNGRIVIETDDDNIAVMIQKAGGVKIVDQANQREYHLRPGEQSVRSGEYLIDVSEPLAGLEFQTKRFQLKRGKEVRLTARYMLDNPGNADAALTVKEEVKVTEYDGIYQGKPTRHWLKQLEDGDPKIRAEAVKALGGIAQKNPNVISILVAVLTDPSDTVGNEASEALRDAGQAAFPTIFKILQNRKDTVAHDRMTSALINKRFDQPPGNAPGGALGGAPAPFGQGFWAAPLPFLSEALKIDDDDIRVATIEALGTRGEKAKFTIPTLVSILGNALTVIEDAVKKKAPINDRGLALPGLIFACIYNIDTTTDLQELFDVPELKEIEKTLPLWRQAHKALAAKFPSPSPTQLSTAPSKTGSDNVLSPKTDSNSDESYQGKPASFWLNQLRDGDVSFQVEAIKAIGGLARINPKYIPILVGKLNDANVGYAASKSLAAAGADAVPALLEILTGRGEGKSPLALRNAILAAGKIGPQAKDAVPLIERALSSDDTKVCAAAVYALGAIGSDAKAAMPALVQMLGTHLKSRDFFYVSALSPADAPSLSPVERNARVFNNSFAGGSTPAGTLGGNFIYAVFTLKPKLRPEFNNPDGGVIGNFTGKLAEDDELARWKAVYDTLKKEFPNPPPAQSSIGIDPSTTPPKTSEAGALYLGKTATFWWKQYQDAAPKFRLEAIEALGNLAGKDKSLIPAVVAGLNDADFEVGQKTSEMLHRIGPDALPAILTGLDRKSPEAMKHAADAIAWYGPKGKDATPMLVAALKIDNWQACRASVNALARIGRDAKPALPALVDLMGVSLATKETAEQIEGMARLNAEGKKSGFSNYGPGRALPIEILEAIFFIDPDLKGKLPEGIHEGGRVRSSTGINLAAPLALWKETHEALKKRYAMPIAPSAVEPPATKTNQDEEVLFRNKPARYWIEQLKDASPKVRIEAVEAIGLLARKSRELEAVLIGALGDDSQWVVAKAAQHLRALGPHVIAGIVKAADPKSAKQMSHVIGSAIDWSRPEAKAAIPMLAETLGHRTSVSAIGILGDFGPDANAALPALVGYLGWALDDPAERDALKQNVEAANSKDGQKVKDAGEWRGIPVRILDAMLKISPTIKNQMPKEMMRSDGARSEMGVNLAAPMELWRTTHDGLRQRYPQTASENRDRDSKK